MTSSAISLNAVLAQTGTSAFRAIEYDLPDSPLAWLLYGGGFLLLAVVGLRIQFRDTRECTSFWRVWLLALRFAVLAGIAVIALNPQERTQKMAFRPSSVAVLIDRSLSMQFPESQPGESADGAVESAPAADGGKERTRSAAVRDLLADSALIESLRRNHTVSIYSFDSALNGPHATLRSLDPRARPATPDEAPADASSNTTGGSAATDPAGSASGPDWSAIADATGLETRLGESLSELVRMVNNRSLSGIVVISDGASNAGVSPQSALDQTGSDKVRLVTVGVGSTQQPVNLQVASLQAPSDVQSGDSFEITAFVQAQGFSGQQATVELFGRPEDVDTQPDRLAAQEIIVGADGIPTRVAFEQLQNQAGNWEYFVRVTGPAGRLELSDSDNERRKAVNVVDRKTKVLVIAGGPMRDYRFVRNMLYRHSAIDTFVWLQSSDAAGAVSQEADKILTSFPDTKEQMFEYDVTLAFDADWDRLKPEQIDLLKDWVFAQAGGLILIGGDVYTPLLAASPKLEGLRELCPVVLNSFIVGIGNDRPVTQAWPFDFSREGREAGFLQLTDDLVTSADVWKEFAGVYSCYPTSGAKAGATVYAFFSDPRSQSSYGQPILLASQYYGAGRVLYLGSPEIWRLRAIDEVYYDRFWTKSIREAGQARLKRGNNRGTLLLERTQYVLGQTVRLRAQVLNPQFEPLESDAVTAEIYDPDGRPMLPSLRLSRDANRAGQYAGSFRVSRAGVWKIELPVPQSADVLSEKVDVVLPNLEMDNARQNAQLLRTIAEDSGGAYFPIADAAAGVPEKLPNMGEEFEIDQQLRTLWDRTWVMYGLVTLLGIEWLTRKLLKLA